MPNATQAIAYYFSGTGRTWRIAQLYANELHSRGVPCAMVPLELGALSEIAETDDSGETLLILAVPLYGRGIVPEIAVWLDELGAGNDRRRVALACTCRSNQGHAVRDLAQLVESRGHDVIHEAVYFSSAEPWPSGASRAWLEADIHEAVGEISARSRRTVGPAEGLDTPTAWVRAAYWLARRSPGRHLSVAKSCSLCMTCLRLCPVGAISIARPKDAREGHDLGVEIDGSCMLCLRCAAACPAGAIAPRRTRWLQGLDERIKAEPGFIDAIRAAYDED